MVNAANRTVRYHNEAIFDVCENKIPVMEETFNRFSGILQNQGKRD